MSDIQEANVSTQQPQSEHHSMQKATTDGPPFAPVSDRRGGPMDLGEPMQDIQPLPSQQQHQQQQQQCSQLQPQSQPQGEGQHDPRTLMHPLQPQVSNQSTQSNQSFQSFQSFQSVESGDSSSQQQNSGGGFSGGSAPSQQQQQMQQQQQHHPLKLQQPYINPSQATTSSSLTSALGHLAPPQHSLEKPKSRRWSLTGRFFEKRKSITEPFHVPGGAPPSSFSSSYKNTNANIVSGADGKEGQESGLGGRARNNGGNFDHTSNTSNHNNNNTMTASTMGAGSINSQSSSETGGGGTDSKNSSPPGSNGNSRRSSLADLPKAILSSLRRSSLVGPGEACNVMAAVAASMGSIGAGQGAGDTIIEEDEDLDEDGGVPKVWMALPKAPPHDPHTSRPPPKSILKKRPSETNLATADAAGVDSASAGATASTGDAAADDTSATSTANANATNDQQPDQALSSESVHPMATADMDVTNIDLFAPTDHRARLLTHSPPPTHPQQHLVNDNADKSPILIGGAGSPMPSNNSDSVSSNNSNDNNSNNNDKNKVQQVAVSSSQGAALPPDFTPGVQSNSYYKDRGGERGQGAVGDYISQDELLTQQMMGISSRAQDLAKQYYGTNTNTNNTNNTNNQTSSTAHTLAPIASAAAGAGRKRSIYFLETVEIIPAHRKSDYNRQSDKHATFKILTPDMKSEIRDELNTYKMREMAVHVESMANTAFH
ncbi:hypothetical protein EC957_007802 [Mortierella hygrophila]|uniref:Uncharacterized protein n=1 Tax=Mortierella hygrophila TaxID=979708 RepID=A0A9P6JYE4_9FUNG|nr:hypothetical protein EC957_007802 [Mortierella hygrophila]